MENTKSMDKKEAHRLLSHLVSVERPKSAQEDPQRIQKAATDISNARKLLNHFLSLEKPSDNVPDTVNINMEIKRATDDIEEAERLIKTILEIEKPQIYQGGNRLSKVLQTSNQDNEKENAQQLINQLVSIENPSKMLGNTRLSQVLSKNIKNEQDAEAAKQLLDKLITLESSDSLRGDARFSKIFDDKGFWIGKDKDNLAAKELIEKIVETENKGVNENMDDVTFKSQAVNAMKNAKDLIKQLVSSENFIYSKKDDEPNGIPTSTEIEEEKSRPNSMKSSEYNNQENIPLDGKNAGYMFSEACGTSSLNSLSSPIGQVPEKMNINSSSHNNNGQIHGIGVSPILSSRLSIPSNVSMIHSFEADNEDNFIKKTGLPGIKESDYIENDEFIIPHKSVSNTTIPAPLINKSNLRNNKHQFNLGADNNVRQFSGNNNQTNRHLHVNGDADERDLLLRPNNEPNNNNDTDNQQTNIFRNGGGDQGNNDSNDSNDSISKNNKKNLWSMILACLFAGLALFSDGYQNGIIGFINSVLPVVGQDQYNEDISIRISNAAIIGQIFGQLAFGFIVDKFGRKVGLLGCTILVVVGALSSSIPFSNSFLVTTWIITISRFILGIGVGGEYPCSSTAASETADSVKQSKRGGIFILVTNFVLDFGFVFSAILPAILLVIFGYKHVNNASPINDNVNFDAIWRIALGFGALPPLLILYSRLKYTNEERFEKNAIKHDIPWKLIIGKYWKRLLVTCSIWFLYDFIAYPASFFWSRILSKGANSYDLLSKQSWGILLYSFYLPGAATGAFLVDKIGRKKTMAAGFIIQAVFALIIALGYDTLSENYFPLFVVLYGLYLSSAEVGPGDCIGLVSSEVYPTAVRGKAYGISAAIGKIGAVVGTFVFVPISKALSVEGNESLGDRVTFIIGGVIGLVGAFLTIVYLPDFSNRSLDEEDEEFKDYLLQHGYHGSINNEEDNYHILE